MTKAKKVATTIVAATMGISSIVTPALAAGATSYKSDFDYSAALADPTLDAATRAQYEAERAAKIADKYNGVEPNMSGSNSTFSSQYDSTTGTYTGTNPITPQKGSTSYDKATTVVVPPNNTSSNTGSLTQLQQSAIATLNAAVASGAISQAEANNAIYAIQNGNAVVNENSQVVSTLLKAMGMSESAQNKSEAATLINGAYNSSQITGAGEQVGSALVDENGNAMYYEAGKIYKQDANGNWVVNYDYGEDIGAVDLDQETINKIIQLKIDYSNATSVEERQAIHDAAEALRNGAGYSGGLDGSFFDPTSNGGTPSPGTGGSTPAPDVIESYTIISTAGTGGSISPAGTSEVIEGTNRTYTITPAAGYEVKDVKVDGVSIGAKTSYTFFNVNADHTIDVTFKSEMGVNIGELIITGVDTNAAVGNSVGALKSGYGFGMKLPITFSNASIKASAKMSNGDTCKVELINGELVFVKNAESVTDARVYYVPVDTRDGDFTCTVTIIATNVNNSSETMTFTAQKTITIKGSMYEDDFSADHR